VIRAADILTASTVALAELVLVCLILSIYIALPGFVY
jgi:hypothetical protein